jgi:hypothetical protein
MKFLSGIILLIRETPSFPLLMLFGWDLLSLEVWVWGLLALGS